VLQWIPCEARIDTGCIDPGKPQHKGSKGSHHSKPPDERLAVHGIQNRIAAKILIG
jgi:hypothetical protein